MPRAGYHRRMRTSRTAFGIILSLLFLVAGCDLNPPAHADPDASGGIATSPDR